jgi:hypothetical protein
MLNRKSPEFIGVFFLLKKMAAAAIYESAYIPEPIAFFYVDIA